MAKYLDEEGLSYYNTKINEKLNNKVDKVTNKGLSTNDFTTTYKNNVDSNTNARHTHSNKSTLDTITSTMITSWNNKSDFSGNYSDLTGKPNILTGTSEPTSSQGSDGDIYLVLEA